MFVVLFRPETLQWMISITSEHQRNVVLCSGSYNENENVYVFEVHCCSLFTFYVVFRHLHTSHPSEFNLHHCPRKTQTNLIFTLIHERTTHHIIHKSTYFQLSNAQKLTVSENENANSAAFVCR